MSNGEKAASPDYWKYDRRIRKLQKKLARQVRCLNCDTEYDQDESAAKNIELSRHRALGDSKRIGSDRKTSSQASCCELSRITVASAR